MLIYLQMIETDEDRDKFLYIYETQQKTMLYAARKLLNNPYDVEDAVQSAFTAIAKHIKTVRCDNEFELRAFVTTIAEHMAINIIRKSKQLIPVDMEVTTYISDDFLPGISELDVLIEQLPRNYQEVIYMRYVCGYDTYEIAGFLGIKRDSAQKLLKRAKEKLAEKISEQRHEEARIYG